MPNEEAINADQEAPATHRDVADDASLSPSKTKPEEIIEEKETAKNLKPLE